MSEKLYSFLNYLIILLNWNNMNEKRIPLPNFHVCQISDEGKYIFTKETVGKV